ncbi:ChaN family lipoprotein [Nitrosophilus alvini]|uniref:ChaN family lipoprotein n=1 Tax=Nitrosophilus alvini TaxID=2714855 RepID=UPI00190AB01F|nr:ChaN family lipoprotein [Nitrosophilus alvini]
MKKILTASALFLSLLFANECNYNLNIDLDMEKNELRGISKIQTDKKHIRLLDTNANITDIKNAKMVIKEGSPYLIKDDSGRPVEIKFVYGFKSFDNTAVLLEGWYPVIDEMCSYETFVSNRRLKTVVEATDVEKRKNGYIFRFDHPLDSVHLISSDRYVPSSADFENGIEISAYLYPSDSHLAEKYLEKSDFYFNMYKNMFGFLPFKRFLIVEVPFPAGYSMPTYTLIGKQIIDKDFVLDNSLGHEIVHQWFGNYVYAPYRGNWVEGLTTFYSDYLYAVRQNRAIEYRKDLLIKYDSYVNSSNEIALIEFEYKTKESKNAIGYGKAAYFFYMLEKKIGKDAFERGVKKLLQEYPFKTASYKNLREIFEETSGKKLLGFFKTWVYKKGAFDFNIDNIKLSFVDEKYRLEFDITSNSMIKFLPLKICSEDECLSTKIDLTKKRQKLDLDIEPKKIVVDDRYEIFRRLQPKEIPPVISKILQGNVIAVIDRKDEEKFSKMAKVFKNFRYADELRFDEVKNGNILILGSDNSFLKQIALPFKMEGDTKIEVFKNPFNDRNVVAVFDAVTLSKAIFYKLRHLGKYSTVVFEKGKIVKKETKPSQNGAVFKVKSGSYALKPHMQKLQDIYPDIINRKVVFIGEQHTEFSNHLNQLKIIKAMFEKDPKLAIGMEMFQEPFQKYLDEFIEGRISEKEMLKKTEYFKRWKYDYNLYRPIILFAKKHKIPIVALNIEREITKKVVREGIDSLSKEERAKVPKSIDFGNREYKEELKRIFSGHQAESFKNFDEFYNAQLLWDETMAKNVARFLHNNPEFKMAVLAGNGHVMFGYGIPDRIKRRGITDYKIVINSMKPKPGIADYLLYPEKIDTPKTKKIGVYLEGDDDLTVVKLVEKSPAAKAGIKKGDRIVALNGERVESIFDLKAELVFVENEAEVTVLRGTSEKNIKIVFEQGE